MSDFALMVNAAPSDRAGRHALEFARAASAEGQRLSIVFFVHDGAAVADNRLDSPLQSEWRSWARQSGCELVVCSGSASDRGIIDTATASRLGRSRSTLAEDFVIGGLALWQDAAAKADHSIRFGR